MPRNPDPVAQLLAVHQAHSKGLFCFHDWGSGSFYRFKQRGLSEYATAEQELAAGPDLLAFSGDKLLGGIQAGCNPGRGEPSGIRRVESKQGKATYGHTNGNPQAAIKPAKSHL